MPPRTPKVGAFGDINHLRALAKIYDADAQDDIATYRARYQKERVYLNKPTVQPAFSGAEVDVIGFITNAVSYLGQRGIPNYILRYLLHRKYPANWSMERKAADRELYQLLSGWLTGTAKSGLITHLNSQSGHMVFQDIVDRFLERSSTRRTTIHTELYNISYKGTRSESLPQFFTRFRNLSLKLQAVGGTIDPGQLLTIASSALRAHSHLRSYVDAITDGNADCDIEMLETKLLQKKELDKATNMHVDNDKARAQLAHAHVQQAIAEVEAHSAMGTYTRTYSFQRPWEDNQRHPHDRSGLGATRDRKDTRDDSSFPRERPSLRSDGPRFQRGRRQLRSRSPPPGRSNFGNNQRSPSSGRPNWTSHKGRNLEAALAQIDSDAEAQRTEARAHFANITEEPDEEHQATANMLDCGLHALAQAAEASDDPFASANMMIVEDAHEAPGGPQEAPSNRRLWPKQYLWQTRSRAVVGTEFSANVLISLSCAAWEAPDHHAFVATLFTLLGFTLVLHWSQSSTLMHGNGFGFIIGVISTLITRDSTCLLITAISTLMTGDSDCPIVTAISTLIGDLIGTQGRPETASASMMVCGDVGPTISLSADTRRLIAHDRDVGNTEDGVTATKPQTTDNQDPILDSGTTHHIKRDRASFGPDFEPCRIPIVHAGNNVIYAEGIGTATDTLELKSGRTVELRLRQTLWVPGASRDLISTHGLEEMGCTVILRKGKSEIILENGARVVLRRSGRLRTLPIHRPAAPDLRAKGWKPASTHNAVVPPPPPAPTLLTKAELLNPGKTGRTTTKASTTTRHNKSLWPAHKVPSAFKPTGDDDRPWWELRGTKRNR